MTAHKLFKTASHTIGEFVNAVLAIHDKGQAREFFSDYVEWNMAHVMKPEHTTPDGAADLARSNIGWCFGEGMPAEDIGMWVEACGASHPVFGATLPTSAREAMALGALAAVDPEAARRVGSMGNLR